MTPEQAGSFLSINLKKIADNWRFLKEKVGESCDCAAVLKTNAYGLGAKEVALALAVEGCKTFFVAHVFEGIALRKAIANGTIYVLHGNLPGTEADFVKHNLTPVLNTRDQVLAWAGYAQKHNEILNAAIHVDTGMRRLGLTPLDVMLFSNSPSLLNGIHLDMVMSHLAFADEPYNEINEQQLGLFDTLCARLAKIKPYPFIKSLSASGGIFLGRPFHKDLVRPGIALYGGIAGFEGLRLAVSLYSKIIQVQEIEKGVPVGYGLTQSLPYDGRIATVALGYGDGYPRSMSGKGIAFIGHEMVRILGRISMDLMVLDVSDVPEKDLYCGQKVEFIGENSHLSDVARQVGMIEYEILTNLGRRFYRSYVE